MPFPAVEINCVPLKEPLKLQEVPETEPVALTFIKEDELLLRRTNFFPYLLFLLVIDREGE